jgi:hypothetical protein
MISRSFIRRLDQLEARLGVGRHHTRIEFYNLSPEGTLIRRPHPNDDDETEAELTIKVIFVKPAGTKD